MSHNNMLVFSIAPVTFPHTEGPRLELDIAPKKLPDIRAVIKFNVGANVEVSRSLGVNH